MMFLLIHVGVGTGCSPKLQEHSFETATFLTGQVIPDQVRREQLENAELSLNDDLDGDQTIDRLDQDIDGDGVLNLVDQAPFDANATGEDQDQDGIPDWIDYLVGGVLAKNITYGAAILQENIFNEYHIYVISDRSVWSENELQFIETELASGLYAKFTGLKRFTPVIVKIDNTDSGNLELGRYHPYWKSLFIDSEVVATEEIFLHEVFHALRYFDSSMYEQFMKKSGWSIIEGLYETDFIFNSPEDSQDEDIEISEFDLTHNLTETSKKLVGPWFPTEYSKVGPEEMFAECGVATLLKLRHKQNNYVQNQEFYQTQLFKWFSSL